MAIDLYHAVWSPPSRAVRMIARAAGVQLNLITCDPIQGQHLKPAFLKMNPMHTIPTINDNGFILWESRAIGQYLIHKYAPDSSLIPKDVQRRALYDQRLFFDYSMLVNFTNTLRRVEQRGATQLDPADLKRCRGSLKLLNGWLACSDYVAGDSITMVDYTAAATVVTGQAGMVDLSETPNVQSWLNQVSHEIDGFDEINNPGVEMMSVFMNAILGESKV